MSARDRDNDGNNGYIAYYRLPPKAAAYFHKMSVVVALLPDVRTCIKLALVKNIKFAVGITILSVIIVSEIYD